MQLAVDSGFTFECEPLMCCACCARCAVQFLAKKQSSVRLGDLAGLAVGQKDMTKGAFAVWTELLQKRVRSGWIGS